MLRENTLKTNLESGKTACGYAVMSRSPLIVEMLGFSGFDWLFIDTEHVPIGSDMTLENLIRAAEASNTVPIVRVKENREQYIRNALEAGAMGVVVPHVATKEDAQRAVSYARFPPKGIRGADPTVRAARYRTGNFNWEAFINHNNEQTMVIPLLEDKECVDNIDAILDVEGIDAVSFGPTDYALSIGLNLLYDFNHPRIVEAFEAVVAAARKRRMPVLSAVNPCTVEQSKKLAGMGVKFQLFGTDIGLIAGAIDNLMQGVVSKVKSV